MGKIKDIAGQRFGKLIAIKRAEDYISPTGRKEVQWLCLCDCGNEIVVRRSSLVSGQNTQSCGCLKSEWSKLYDYVKKEIMNYDDNQHLSKNMVLRLKGLTSGNYIQKKGQDEISYSFEIIRLTFMDCKQTILDAFRKKDFHNEEHKLNYAARIVESRINDIYLRVQRNKKAEEEIKDMDIPTINYEGATYQSRNTAQNNNSSDSDLW